MALGSDTSSLAKELGKEASLLLDTVQQYNVTWEETERSEVSEEVEQTLLGFQNFNLHNLDLLSQVERIRGLHSEQVNAIACADVQTCPEDSADGAAEESQGSETHAAVDDFETAHEEALFETAREQLEDGAFKGPVSEGSPVPIEPRELPGRFEDDCERGEALELRTQPTEVEGPAATANYTRRWNKSRQTVEENEERTDGWSDDWWTSNNWDSWDWSSSRRHDGWDGHDQYGHDQWDRHNWWTPNAVSASSHRTSSHGKDWKSDGWDKDRTDWQSSDWRGRDWWSHKWLERHTEQVCKWPSEGRQLLWLGHFWGISGLEDIRIW